MLIGSKRIPAHLMAKLEGKTRIPDGNFEYIIQRESKKITIERWNPKFRPTVLLEGSDINVTPTYILKPCRWFKGAFKVSRATEQARSGLALAPSKGQRPTTKKINKKEAAATLRIVFERLG